MVLYENEVEPQAPQASTVVVEEIEIGGTTLRILESCHSIWIFEPGRMRFRRVPRGTRLDMPSPESEWTPYYRLEVEPSSASVAAGVQKAVSQIFTPPREDESRRGLRTFVNPATAVLSATVENNIATIDFSGLPAVGIGNEQVAMALAQIVYTATSFGTVVGVQFTQNGKKLSVPTSDGSQTSLPVGRASYAPSYGPL